ncbi:MAG: single-stranded-DNA-specific exonuclease RecJ [Phycisphaeraceae bacterium]|nr:single-stranded-DNA-specific exonuclease RecJ [Phycisphaeraceae bacterium]
MKGLIRRWIPRSPNAVAALASTSRLVDRVLAARGWTDSDARSLFLDPKLSHLRDPASLPGVDRAAERLLEALRADQTIVIYGDYDVDGVTATAVLFHTLRALRPDARPDQILTYVPHRIEEGYGLNADAIEELAAVSSPPPVIVSVDCGVTAFEPARRARTLGVDLIITDHHNLPDPADGLPDAFAIVHPRLPGSEYGFGELCGAGVAYKLAWRLCTMSCGSDRVPPDIRTLLVDLLAFASLGVIADVVPLVDENRVIARFGLDRVKHSCFVGLEALVRASKLDGDTVSSSDVGFRLAPRLNAAGRLGHAAEAVELFTTADRARAKAIAERLSAQNDERRKVEQRIAEQAQAMALESGMTGRNQRAIVLAHDQWHPGVVGIACSRLVDRFCRPVILLCKSGSPDPSAADAPSPIMYSGSGRSINGYSLHAGLTACAAHLERFGGHDMAAGLHLYEVKLPGFIESFIAHANASITDDMLVPAVEIDADTTLADLRLNEVRLLECMAPFGRDNPQPNLRIDGLRLREAPRPMGATGKHLALTFGQDRPGASGNARFRVVAWNWADRLHDHPDRPLERLRSGVPVRAVITPRINSWNGSNTVEGELVDLAIGND